MCCKCYHNTWITTDLTDSYRSSHVTTPGLPPAPLSLTVVQYVHSHLSHTPGHHTLHLPSILYAGCKPMICISCRMQLSLYVLEFNMFSVSTCSVCHHSRHVHWIYYLTTTSMIKMYTGINMIKRSKALIDHLNMENIWRGVNNSRYPSYLCFVSRRAKLHETPLQTA